MRTQGSARVTVICLDGGGSARWAGVTLMLGLSASQ